MLSTGTKHTQRDLNLKTCKRALKEEWKIQLKLPIYLGWHIHVTHRLNFQVSVICASIFFLKNVSILTLFYALGNGGDEGGLLSDSLRLAMWPTIRAMEIFIYLQIANLF